MQTEQQIAGMFVAYVMLLSTAFTVLNNLLD